MGVVAPAIVKQRRSFVIESRSGALMVYWNRGGMEEGVFVKELVDDGFELL